MMILNEEFFDNIDNDELVSHSSDSDEQRDVYQYTMIVEYPAECTDTEAADICKHIETVFDYADILISEPEYKIQVFGDLYVTFSINCHFKNLKQSYRLLLIIGKAINFPNYLDDDYQITIHLLNNMTLKDHVMFYSGTGKIQRPVKHCRDLVAKEMGINYDFDDSNNMLKMYGSNSDNFAGIINKTLVSSIGNDCGYDWHIVTDCWRRKPVYRMKSLKGIYKFDIDRVRKDNKIWMFLHEGVCEDPKSASFSFTYNYLFSKKDLLNKDFLDSKYLDKLSSENWIEKIYGRDIAVSDKGNVVMICLNHSYVNGVIRMDILTLISTNDTDLTGKLLKMC